MNFQQEVMEENYSAVQEDLHKLCSYWRTKRGGDRDELIQETFLYFADAVDRFDGGGDWRKWTLYRVHLNLLQHARDIRRQREKEKRDTDFDIQDLFGRPDTSSNLDEFFGNLTMDATLVSYLALDPPQELQKEIQAKGGRHQNIRSAIRQYLYDLGWSAKRVAEAYAEIVITLQEIGS